MKKELQKIIFDLERFKIINKKNCLEDNIDFLEKTAENLEIIIDYCHSNILNKKIIIIEKKIVIVNVNEIESYNTIKDDDKIYAYYNYLITTFNDFIFSLIEHGINTKMFFQKRRILIEKQI